MDNSIALAADPSRLASLPVPVLGSHPSRMLPSGSRRRLASRAPRPRSSIDLSIRGPLVMHSLDKPKKDIIGVHAEPLADCLQLHVELQSLGVLALRSGLDCFAPTVHPLAEALRHPSADPLVDLGTLRASAQEFAEQRVHCPRRIGSLLGA